MHTVYDSTSVVSPPSIQIVIVVFGVSLSFPLFFSMYIVGTSMQSL